MVLVDGNPTESNESTFEDVLDFLITTIGWKEKTQELSPSLNLWPEKTSWGFLLLNHDVLNISFSKSLGSLIIL